jgi:hypothetical protein
MLWLMNGIKGRSVSDKDVEKRIREVAIHSGLRSQCSLQTRMSVD